MRPCPISFLVAGSWIRTNDLRYEAWVEYGLAAVDNGPELVYDLRTKWIGMDYWLRRTRDVLERLER